MMDKRLLGLLNLHSTILDLNFYELFVIQQMRQNLHSTILDLNKF